MSGSPGAARRDAAGRERLLEIAAKVAGARRLTPDDALEALACPDLPFLGALADEVRRRLHPEPVVTYVVGRNLNYTNVCWVRCKFCAFYRPPGHAEGYVLTRDQMAEKIQALVDLGGRELLFQGGVNPQLKLDWYLDTFRWIKAGWDVHLHALSPVEVTYVAKISNQSLERALGRLREAGLDTLPGAGGEILVDDVRRRIAPLKDLADEWIEVMRTCHRLGIRTSATMMYGSVESVAQRVEHLTKIRDLQDETGGFNAFIPWSFQPDLTELAGTRKASGFDYLRTTAVSRLFLDNVRSIQASWVTQGPKVAQVGLRFGVNDFGSTVLEENVVSAAGGTHAIGLPEMIRLIEDAGFRAVPRDTNYTILPVPPREETERRWSRWLAAAAARAAAGAAGPPGSSIEGPLLQVAPSAAGPAAATLPGQAARP